MQINGLQSAQSVQSLAGTQRAKPSQATESVASSSSIPTDQLDLSPEAQALSESQATGASQASTGIRQDRVDAIRQAIANGTYESPEKLSGALDRLLDSFA
ncbi:MAG: flagellar biosynthesis anti-sigma factor FlgM [Pirellulaceae bacterium]|nr:flagellar biosynthesis anti-sigma factor FlgM [Pirellulaceae bacterium]